MENVASSVTNKPRGPEQSDADGNCWTADEASAFLAVAKQARHQPAAMWTVAIDSGMRKSELAAIMWSDLDLSLGQVTVSRQLLKGGLPPSFIPTKGKRSRTIDLSPETVDLLKAHRSHQAEMKMRHRQQYHDFGLVFAKEWSDDGRRREMLGAPLQVNNIGQREFLALIKKAGVRPITIRGLRHTCASLLLAARAARCRAATPS